MFKNITIYQIICLMIATFAAFQRHETHTNRWVKEVEVINILT